jgi:arylamine N-acetyltransferase
MPLSTIQVKSYLDRISVSESNRTQLRQGPCGQHALEAVATLQRQHLKHVPFENLDLMYSSHHSLLQDTDSVFDRVVTQQRGGVCDQIHLLFMELLKHFGFSVYCTGSRINSAASLGVVSGRGAVRPNENIVPKFGPW